jgi:hypothetical protein
MALARKPLPLAPVPRRARAVAAAPAPTAAPAAPGATPTPTATPQHRAKPHAAAPKRGSHPAASAVVSVRLLSARARAAGMAAGVVAAMLLPAGGPAV